MKIPSQELRQQRLVENFIGYNPWEVPLGETIINAQLVEKYIKKLKPSKSQGPDKCRPKFLQETIDEVTEPLKFCLTGH